MERRSAGAGGNALLIVAVALFAIGLVAIATIFLVPILTDHNAGLAIYVSTLAAPLGFLLAIVFALRSGRRVRSR